MDAREFFERRVMKNFCMSRATFDATFATVPTDPLHRQHAAATQEWCVLYRQPFLDYATVEKPSDENLSARSAIGTLHFETCRLCELFAAGGTTQPLVEVERLNKPKLSDGLAVHPDQVPEFMAEDKKRGVPIEYHRDGRAVINSRAQQKAYLTAYGFHNRDGGYGD